METSGGVESWNRGAEELYGFTERQAIGRGVHDLLNTRHALPWDEFEKVLREKGHWNGEVRHTTRGGADVVVSSRLHLGHGTDGELRVLQIDRDITEQKRIQDELRQARDELEEKVRQRTTDLQKANRDLLMISACDQALVQMSNEHELIAVICHIIQEEGGYPLVWVGLRQPEGSSELQCTAFAGEGQAFLDALRRGAPQGLADGPAGEAINDGRAVIVEDVVRAPDDQNWKTQAIARGFRSIAAFPLLNPAATAFGVLSICSDTSPVVEKNRLALLVELANDLAFGVMALRARAERDHAQKELESQARQLRILAGEVVRSEQRERQRIAQLLHDQLQQHLAAALYGLNEFRGESTAGQRVETLARLGTLLRESIAMSRSLTSELGHPALMEPDLSVGLDWLAAWMKEKHGLQVSLEVRSPVFLAAEELRITLLQAARELLFNVVKHAGTGRAGLTLDRNAEGRIMVTVSDSGAGFDATRIARLREAGTGGIGLFSVRERLALSGGGIEIDSAPGKGSRVTAWVPDIAPGELVAPPASAQVSASARPRNGAGPASARQQMGAIRLLVVDDHAVVRDGLVMQLGQQPGIEIVGVAADGESAIELAGSLQPDVVTMDVGMPGMGGIAAARRIHALYPDIAVIGVSMYDDEAHAAAMREAGAVAHLSKSASIDILLATIRAAVS